MKGVQCYELFRGIALKNQTFSFFSIVCGRRLRERNIEVGFHAIMVRFK